MAKWEGVASRVLVSSGASGTWSYFLQNSLQSPFTVEQPQYTHGQSSGTQGQWDQAVTRPCGEEHQPGAQGRVAVSRLAAGGAGVPPGEPGKADRRGNVKHCSRVSSPLCPTSQTVGKSMLPHVLFGFLYALSSPSLLLSQE